MGRFGSKIIFEFATWFTLSLLLLLCTVLLLPDLLVVSSAYERYETH